MPVNSIDDLIMIRRRINEGYEPSADELKEVAEFVRAQRGVRGAKKEKSRATKLSNEQVLEIFGL